MKPAAIQIPKPDIKPRLTARALEERSEGSDADPVAAWLESIQKLSRAEMRGEEKTPVTRPQTTTPPATDSSPSPPLDVNALNLGPTATASQPTINTWSALRAEKQAELLLELHRSIKDSITEAIGRYTYVETSASKKARETMERLVRQYPGIVNATSANTQQTALHIACEKINATNNGLTVTIVLAQHGGDLFKANAQKKRPIDLIKTGVQNPADYRRRLNQLMTQDPRSPYDDQAKLNTAAVLGLSIEAEFKTLPDNMLALISKQSPHEGYTTMHWAVLGAATATYYLTAFTSVLRELQQFGDQLSRTDAQGNTPAHLAAQHQARHIYNALKEADAQATTIKNNAGKTAQDYAASNSWDDEQEQLTVGNTPTTQRAATTLPSISVSAASSPTTARNTSFHTPPTARNQLPPIASRPGSARAPAPTGSASNSTHLPQI